MNKYHYLGFKLFVGRSLKYLVYSGERVIGGIGFCDPAWSLSSRDHFFAKLGVSEAEIRMRGINNGRFLILPWINVPNLASRILSLATKKVTEDWKQYYAVNPLFVETFVNSRRFNGTCYMAANWLMIGKTNGYRKSGRSHVNSQIAKLVYLYPLNKSHRLR
jgi:hypothetical protein